MITTKEYLEIKRKCPNPADNSKYHTHYEGEQEDFDKIVEYNKALIKRFPFLLPRNRWTDLPVYEKPYTDNTFDEYTKTQFIRKVKQTAKQKENGWNIELVEGLATEEEAIEFLNNNPDKFEEIKSKQKANDEALYKYNYSYTELDDMPDGWRLAFGDEMLEKLRAELIRFDYLDKYRITQIKEKFGGLRWYDSGVPIGKLSGVAETVICKDGRFPKYNWRTDNYKQITRDERGLVLEHRKVIEACQVQEIINQYEELSYHTCINCGKPAKWQSTGWICPYCDDCMTELTSKGINFVTLED